MFSTPYTLHTYTRSLSAYVHAQKSGKLATEFTAFRYLLYYVYKSVTATFLPIPAKIWKIEDRETLLYPRSRREMVSVRVPT